MKNLKLVLLSRFGIAFTIMAAFTIAFATSCDPKPPKNSRAVQAQKGKLHFQKYCSVCHGQDGTGLVIDTFDIQPADLTMIRATRKNDEFPILEIANIIDGRKMSKAHGTRDMPIWGEVFSTDDHLTESQIKGKLGEIIAYLMSIQR
ncbi:MAG: cytochrome c [Bacteroidota bacterium]